MQTTTLTALIKADAIKLESYVQRNTQRTEDKKQTVSQEATVKEKSRAAQNRADNARASQQVLEQREAGGQAVEKSKNLSTELLRQSETREVKRSEKLGFIEKLEHESKIRTVQLENAQATLRNQEQNNTAVARLAESQERNNLTRKRVEETQEQSVATQQRLEKSKEISETLLRAGASSVYEMADQAQEKRRQRGRELNESA